MIGGVKANEKIGKAVKASSPNCGAASSHDMNSGKLRDTNNPEDSSLRSRSPRLTRNQITVPKTA